jgi:Lon protease-like protein
MPIRASVHAPRHLVRPARILAAGMIASPLSARAVEYVARVPARRYSDEELERAIERLGEMERLRSAEALVARAAPRLQRVLATALEAGGWFGEAHESQVLKAATTPDEDERLTAVRTLLAEETRMGMLVGVAVGWALANELAPDEEEE